MATVPRAQVVDVLTKIMSRRTVADIAGVKYIGHLTTSLSEESEKRLRIALVVSIILSQRFPSKHIETWFTHPCPFLHGFSSPIDALQAGNFDAVREAAHASI